MYKLFIVDDEKLVVDGLKSIIEWEKHQIEVIGSAMDGTNALARILALKPHIVMTDIRMPGMNGLELIQHLREKAPDIVCLIISGYSEFNYAKSAIELEAIDYLIKPIELDEIVKSVKNAIVKYEKKQNEKKSESLLKHSDFISQSLFFDLMMGRRIIEDVTFGAESDNYTAVVAESTSRYWEKAIQRSDVPTIIAEYFHERGFQAFTYIYQTSLLLLCSYQRGRNINVADRLRNALSGIHPLLENVMPDYSMGEITMGVGKTCFRVQDVHDGFKSAREALKFCQYTNKPITFYHEMVLAEQHQETLTVEAIVEHYCEIQGFHAFELYSKIDQLTGFSHQSMLKPTKLREIYFHLINVIFTTVIHEYEVRLETVLGERFEMYDKLNKMISIDEMGRWMKEQVEKTDEYLKSLKSSYKEKLIHDIKLFIQRNDSKDLKLNDIADQFNISPAYISSLFSKTAGMTIVDYITEQRMEKAKDYLRNSNDKILKIGEMVHYDNQRYFCQVFKKYEGLTPSEYRQKHGL